MDNQRLIDANELLKKATYAKTFTPYMLVVGQGYVHDAPTIDPVKHGHIVWREQETGGVRYEKGRCLKCGQDAAVEIACPKKEKIPYCSECGKQVSDRHFSFCPSCGAELGGEEK